MSSERNLTPDAIAGLRHELLQKALRTAVVRDADSGYILLPWVNGPEGRHQIDSDSERLAAQLAAHHFRDAGITHIAPIPQSGWPFGIAVAGEMGVERVLSSIKFEEQADGTWFSPAGITLLRDGNGRLKFPQVEDFIYTNPARSFTRATRAIFAIENGVGPGDRVLMVDDFCAHGSVGGAWGSALLRTGAEVFSAVYVAKLFQGGFTKIEALGIPSFHAVGITRVSGSAIEVI